MTAFQVQLISPEQTYPLRHRILRPHQPLDSCHYPEDFASTTFHVGALHNGDAIGIASFNTEMFSKIQARHPFRLRGMATDLELQLSGVGRSVLTFGEKELITRGCDMLWFNARQVAFPFYEKLGYQYVGELFDIPGIGLHKVMYKHFS